MAERKLKIRIAAVVIVIIVVLLALYFAKAWQNAANAPKYTPHASIVPFAQVKKTAWYERVSSVGTVHSSYGIDLKADYAGKLTKVFVTPGSLVKKGQKLFQINPKILHAELMANKAELITSRDNFLRMKTLYQKHVASQQAFDQARSQYREDLANVHKAEQQLALTVERAPFDGYFGLSQYHLGDYVQPGDVLGSLQSVHNLYVDFSVPESYLQHIRIGDPVVVKSPQLKLPLQTKVNAIDSQIDADTRTLMVRAQLPDQSFMPGSYTDIILLLRPKKDVMVLPQTAVTLSVTGSTVYLVDNGKAKKTIVQVGERRGNQIEILKGLKPGDTVVSAGQDKVMPGMKVTDKGGIK